MFKRIAPSGSEPAKMYGTIKVHKNNAPARPIVSTIGAHNYQLARYLSEHYVGYLKTDMTKRAI